MIHSLFYWAGLVLFLIAFIACLSASLADPED
jgi:hypothetical protein